MSNVVTVLTRSGWTLEKRRPYLKKKEEGGGRRRRKRERERSVY
jgi:hypothetical protein